MTLRGSVNPLPTKKTLQKHEDSSVTQLGIIWGHIVFRCSFLTTSTFIMPLESLYGCSDGWVCIPKALYHEILQQIVIRIALFTEPISNIHLLLG